MKLNTIKRVRTTENFSMKIEVDELREMINQELKQLGSHQLIPPDATLYVQVPGGGDWSNTALEIDENPIQVEWTVETGEGEL